MLKVISKRTKIRLRIIIIKFIYIYKIFSIRLLYVISFLIYDFNYKSYLVLIVYYLINLVISYKIMNSRK